MEYLNNIRYKWGHRQFGATILVSPFWCHNFGADQFGAASIGCRPFRCRPIGCRSFRCHKNPYQPYWSTVLIFSEILKCFTMKGSTIAADFGPNILSYKNQCLPVFYKIWKKYLYWDLIITNLTEGLAHNIRHWLIFLNNLSKYML